MSPRVTPRFLLVLSASAIVGIACGLTLAPALHAHSAVDVPADMPATMPLAPDFHTPGFASESIEVAFPTATTKTQTGAVILPRDAEGRIVLDVMRQAFNNMPEMTAHRALVQFYSVIPAGQQGAVTETAPLHEFELNPATLRPGGVDNFNVASRERFAIPPGDYTLVIATASPDRANMPPKTRFIEKNPKGFWRLGNSSRYAVGVR